MIPVGSRQFTSAISKVRLGLVSLPSGFSVLGIGVEAVWSDGAPSSFHLSYVEIPCDFWVWWRVLVPFLDTVTRPFARTCPGPAARTQCDTMRCAIFPGTFVACLRQPSEDLRWKPAT